MKRLGKDREDTNMKKCWKQVVMFVLVAVAALWIGRTDAKAATIVETGSCGDSATFTLDSDGVLTISGSGEIKDWAFYNRNDIKKVVIQENITGIGERTFFACTSLTSITIPDSVISIGEHAFDTCNDLESITIPDGVTSIGENAFIMCYNLESITIPNSVTSIGEYAFWDCYRLTSITIPDSVTSIGEEAFMHCSSLTSITIPDSVTSIERGVFCDCSSLTSITIPNSVTSIGTGAFQYCSSLTSITIPDSVTSIGVMAFMHCSSLTSITIPDGVISIGRYAFVDCSSLNSIIIPNSVTSIEDYAVGYGDELAENQISHYAVKKDDFVIYGTKGSAAETYAKENGFTFKTIAGKTKLTSKNTKVKLSKTAFNFDGKAKKPTVKVLDTKGRTLKKSNYTVTYSNNVKVGKATATITFKGKYSGTIKKTFTIKPAKTTITGTSRKSDSVTLTWKKQKKEVSGYQIQYATDRKFTKNAKTVTSKGIKKSSKKISGLSKKTTYYFRVRTYKTVNGKKYYSGWSKIETVKTK